MDGEKVDPEFTAESGWSLGDSDGLSHGCFFGGDYKVSSILNEFGWNIPVESSGGSGRDGGFPDLDPRIESDFAGSRADDYVSAASSTPGSTDPMLLVEEEKVPSASNPSLSSSSSEDRPEKSTDSGVTAANPPSDTANMPMRVRTIFVECREASKLWTQVGGRAGY